MNDKLQIKITTWRVVGYGTWDMGWIWTYGYENGTLTLYGARKPSGTQPIFFVVPSHHQEAA